MQDVREVLRRAQAGQSTRKIAKETGLDRKTVRRYLKEARHQGALDDLAADEETARSVGQRVQERPAAEPSQQIGTAFEADQRIVGADLETLLQRGCRERDELVGIDAERIARVA